MTIEQELAELLAQKIETGHALARDFKARRKRKMEHYTAGKIDAYREILHFLKSANEDEK